MPESHVSEREQLLRRIAVHRQRLLLMDPRSSEAHRARTALRGYEYDLAALDDHGTPVERPACGGSGELIESLTPHLDHRDPAHETREYDCPGCVDCTPASGRAQSSPALDDEAEA